MGCGGVFGEDRLKPTLNPQILSWTLRQSTAELRRAFLDRSR